MASEAAPLSPQPAAGPGRRRVWLLGLPFDGVTLDEAVALVRDAAARRHRLFLTTPNVNFAVAARHDEAFRRSVLESDLSVADGTPIVWLARCLGLPIPERVAGSDLFERLRRPAATPIKVYFFGGAPGVAQRACDVLNQEAGGLVCVGHDTPGFGDVPSMSTPAHLARINTARPDFLVVSLGARKGQAWIQHNLAQLDVPVISHLGAVVNFVAGEVRRAPPRLQRLGLEWAWRVKEEPALLRRYAGDAVRLVPLMASDLVRHWAGRGHGG